MNFSVIIPTYNRCNFLKKAVESILNQTYTQWQLIIVDDGSIDDTEDYIRSLHDERIFYVKQDNHGVAHARNQGIAQARADWICFLDSDDWFLPEKLARTVETIKEYPDIKIFHTEEVWYQRGALLKPKVKHQKPDGDVYTQVLPLCCISISTVAIHRSVFDTVGVFDEAFEACEDYDFWLRATHQFPVKLIPEYLTEKEGGRPDQLSMKTWGMDRFRIRALVKMCDSGVLDGDQYRVTYDTLVKKINVYVKGAARRGKDDEVKEYQLLIKKYSKG